MPGSGILIVPIFVFYLICLLLLVKCYVHGFSPSYSVTNPIAFTNIHIQTIYEGFHSALGEVKDGRQSVVCLYSCIPNDKPVLNLVLNLPLELG